MFANKSNTAKVGALVAVLVMCAAALAGSAYAYTATYVDTIADQPIENVYVTINGQQDEATYGTTALDLDVEYNTLKNSSGTYYNMNAATVNNKTPSEVSTVAASVDANKATFVIDLFTFTLTAYGDKTAEGTLTITGFPTVTFTGATVTYKINGTEVAMTDGKLVVSGIVLDPAADAKDFAVKMTVVVDTINVTETPAATYGAGDSAEKYYSLKTGVDITGPITIDGTDFTARFVADQA